MTQKLNVLVLVAAVPFVLAVDEPATSAVWLVWAAHTVWIQVRARKTGA